MENFLENFLSKPSKNAEELFNVKQIENIRELFERSMNENGDPTAFILKDKIQSNEKYLEIQMSKFISHYKALGEILLKKGFKGKRIGVISENRYEWTVSYAAIICGLGIVVPLDKNLPKEELENILNRADLEAICVSDKTIENLLELNEKNKYNLKNIILMDKYTTKKEQESVDKILENKKLVENNNILSFSQIIEEGKNLRKKESEYDKLEINREEKAEILYTSATTSKSKAVMLSHKNICSNIRDIASMFDVKKGDRLLSILPIFHSFECTVGFIYPLFAGATICYSDGLRKIPDNLKEYKISVMISVPLLLETIYNRIIQKVKKSGKYNQFQFGITMSNTLRKIGVDKRKEIFKEIHEQIGGHLRLVVVGAAALTEETHKKLNEIGINVYQGYGLTETSPVLAAGYGKVNVPGSVGKVLPSVTIKVDKKEDESMGEILVKGPNVMLGYENDEENNREVFTDSGWLKTGDLGYFDKEGNLFISGRAKNVIVLKNGKNVFPDESEVLLNKIPGAKESMVFGYSETEDVTDVVLAAEIVYDKEYFDSIQIEGEEKIQNEIWSKVKEINRIQPTYKYIKKIFITEEPLKKTTTLKIRRHEEMKKINERFLNKNN